MFFASVVAFRHFEAWGLMVQGSGSGMESLEARLVCEGLGSRV